MDPIFEAYNNKINEKRYKNRVKDSVLVKWGMDEFNYSKKEATDWVKTMDSEERREHENEITGEE